MAPHLLLVVLLADSGLATSQNASDATCLLARAPGTSLATNQLEEKDDHKDDDVEDEETHGIEIVSEEKDPKQIFLDSYEEIAALNELMYAAKSLVTTLTGLIPYVGPFISLFVNLFWNTGGGMAEALIEAIQDWTIKYVGSEITKTIHESMQEKFATMSSGLKSYEPCKALVEKKAASGQPIEQQMQSCDITLTQLVGYSEAAMNTVDKTRFRGRLIADYVMASSMKLTLWRERYNAAAFYKKQTKQEPTLIPNTTYCVQSMESNYEKIETALVSMVEEWKKWRQSEIQVKDVGWWKCPGYKLVDNLKPKYDESFLSQDRIACVKTWKDRFLDGPKFQDTLLDMHFRRLQFIELVPMVKMFPSFHQLIPGREKEPLRRGKVLPGRLELGPISSFYNGRTKLLSSNYPRKVFAEQEIPHVDGERWSHLEVHKAARLDQLIFKTNVHPGRATPVLKFPVGASGGEKKEQKTLPFDQCGLHIGFHENMIQKWMTWEIKNLTKTWEGWDEQSGFFNTGAYVCGLYKFRQVTRVSKDAIKSGDAFYVDFQFLPGESR